LNFGLNGEASSFACFGKRVGLWGLQMCLPWAGRKKSFSGLAKKLNFSMEL